MSDKSDDTLGAFIGFVMLICGGIWAAFHYFPTDSAIIILMLTILIIMVAFLF